MLSMKPNGYAVLLMTGGGNTTKSPTCLDISTIPLSTMSALGVRAIPLLRQPLRLGVSASHRWSSSGATSKTQEQRPAPASEPTPAVSTSTPQAKPDPSKPDIDPYAIPPLSRPLGSPFKPTSVPLTREQKIDRLMDQDRRMKNRKHLVKEATQGYFHDYNLAKKANGGKLWLAPPVLIREDVSGV